MDVMCLVAAKAGGNVWHVASKPCLRHPGRRQADRVIADPTRPFVAHPHSGSYDWHCDAQDNLLYLVEGSKQFRVAGAKFGGAAVVDEMMCPGDAIWIPEGLYHNGFGVDNSSVLLSIGFGKRRDGPTGNLWPCHDKFIKVSWEEAQTKRESTSKPTCGDL
eukprot:gnl/TRDRNA2_/TRDRNA2_173693_c0_seq12.p1 gnl/TRDRNA2_/TRDRNA2_173693_c0~~gnl/TRDRNA2_/TRDRNA2_173693_c0_seq12.p1  ORF type:complete len:161 (+),score=7.12 gnl/TRDRNA2_/TRDRNA2_173693_c0_seq12:713-1195(+)